VYDVCKSCGRTIKWARTRADRRIQLDPEPGEAGGVVLQDGAALVLGPAALALLDPATPRYVAHSQTCSRSARHREVKEGSNA
jgi:hypothetical protein